jgi:hypothetical protein
LVVGPFYFYFEQEKGQKETENTKKLKDLPNSQGRGQMRHWEEKCRTK